MNISTVNELIQSLESAGELSIKERKYLELAREFKRVTTENLSMRKILGEVVYSSEEVEHDGYLTFVVSPDSVHDAADLLEGDTPATDRIVAEAEARGVEKAIECIVQTITPNHETILKEFAQQLREGADK